jgi:hypothetical protein
MIDDFLMAWWRGVHGCMVCGWMKAVLFGLAGYLPACLGFGSIHLSRSCRVAVVMVVEETVMAYNALMYGPRIMDD